MKTKNAFKQGYEKHLRHLKLKGLQPKTIDAYSRAIRRIGSYLDGEIDELSEQQLTDYFVDLSIFQSLNASEMYAHSF